jgi:subtilisin family serine protease
MRSRKFISAISVMTVLLMVLAAFAAVPGTAAGEKEQRVIVLFNDTVDEDLITKNNGKVDKKFSLIPAVATKLKPSDIKALEKSDKVKAVEQDATAMILGKPEKPPGQDKPKGGDDNSQPDEVWPWGITKIDADVVHGSSTGAAVKVAVLDTGIDSSHPDLSGNYKGGYNAINPKKRPNDDNGHGTHVAGTIAAIDNTIGVVGVAPDAHLYAVKVLDRRGYGFYSDIIEGLEWAKDNDMDVISMSLGGSASTQSLLDAVNAAYNSGIVLVASSGNNGNSVLYPAKYANVIAVAATDINDDVASFSNPGPEVDLAAPGVNVLSTYKGGAYAWGDGTSMACPHVTGVVALILEDHTIEPAAVKTAMTSTAIDIEDTGIDYDTGHGRVDADAAYGAA